MDIIEMPLSELKMYENNPRKNSEAVQYVMNSIREFGFKNPIIIDKDNVIVCGHTRYKAAMKLKMKKVPCIMADDLTDEQIQAFRLADNKTAEVAGWDFDKLEVELNDLDPAAFDLADFGFFPSYDVNSNDDGYMDPEDKLSDEVKGEDDYLTCPKCGCVFKKSDSTVL